VFGSTAAAKKRFELRVAELGGKLIGEYIDCRTTVLAICSEGHPCLPLPSSLSLGCGMCRTCAGSCPIFAEAEFIDVIKAQGGNVIGKYVRTGDRVHCQCAKGHDCYPVPKFVKSGFNMCQKCSGRSRIEAARKFKENIENLGGTVIGEYIDGLTSVECRCSNNHTWNVTPPRARTGNMCIECYGLGKGKAKLEQHLRLRNFTLVKGYVNSDSRITVRCDKNHEFVKGVASFYKSHGGICTICHPKHMGQTRFLKVLKEMPNLNCEPEFMFPAHLCRYDFSLPDLRILIEFDGQQHFEICGWHPTAEDVMESQEKDREKMYLGAQHGFRMMRFDYKWAWTNLDIVKAAILHCLSEMENFDTMLVVSNPDMYRWMLLDCDNLVEKVINLQIDQTQYLFSAFVLKTKF
jgi:hypothetical protein